MLPKTYHKLIAAQFNKNFREASQIVEVELSRPANDEVIVRNHFAGVNASDVMASAGFYTPGVQPPIDLGAEAVGEVMAVGTGVTGLKVGDLVFTSTTGAGYREYYPVKERFAFPIPEATPEILSLIVSGVTASIGLYLTGEMKSEETVLVTAAAGGTGQFAVQLAKLAGNHVVGTCGTDEKAEMLKGLGCDRPINYRTEDVRSVLKKEYRAGIDLIYESVGGEMFDICVDNLKQYGRLVIIGGISDYFNDPAQVTTHGIAWKLLTKSASLRGMFLPHFRKHIREHLIKLVELYRSGQLKVQIDPTEFVGLDAVPNAVEYLHSGKSLGKVVVKF
jgi:NADPH-dependent curcumin reductase CurA